MEPSPANRDITFSPVLLMKNDVFLSTFHQKSQPVDSVLHTEYHTCYTTTTAQYFNGKEKDYESGFHYYGERYYWSELLTGWLSVDPLADKSPNLSPYHYCHWNPINLIDPDGRLDDEWKLDNLGNIVEHTVSNSFDQIHIIDDDGSIRASSCQYELGTLSEFTLSGSNATIFSVCGDENADDLFEFFAENFTADGGHPLEWGHDVTTDGSNFVGTTHKSDKNGCRSILKNNGYSIKESSHNHPSGCPIPSMFALDPIEHGDLHISEKNPLTTFYIYTPQNGYTKYKNGQILDIQLLELMIERGGQIDCTKLMNTLPWRSK